MKEDVRDYHDPRYFLKGNDKSRNGKRGLGQKIRTMDLKAIWSHYAFTESNSIIATAKENGEKRNLTIRDIENMVVNKVKNERPEFGAINSLLLVNRFKSAFHKGVDHKKYEWEESEGWQQIA